MREMRKERRVATKEWAKIFVPEGNIVFNCTILNTSLSGAKLVIGKAKVPDQFLLYRKADRTLRRAHVRSRVGETLGVSLDAPINPDDFPPGLENLS